MDKYKSILEHIGEPEFRALVAKLSEEERKELWGEYLGNRHLWYITHVARRPEGQNAFAAWLGVSTGSFSPWRSGQRFPDEKNAIKIATRLGPEVFDIIGTPRREPDDEKFKTVANNWARLPKGAQERFALLVEKIALIAMQEPGNVPDIQLVQEKEQ